ncbi:MAG: hypothetical protein A3H97_21385 [Acidobacteria bacterium RIFCSPLOWO2_02_FULL_65_29]|nr:MAG: hypothetical protein A3H97_21385 [Acidobacteria bacterium RIFCSPLOWO2_02_FULL_65_29]
MVSVTSLWLPILLSAVLVFIVSSVLHMVLSYHRNDMRKLPNEDEAMDALRKLNIAPGDYAIPCPSSMEAMRSPEFTAKMNKGPVALMTVVPSGPMSMTKSLAMWFVYSLVISLFSGYIASRALGPGANYLDVFRFVGTAAFMGYGLGLVQFSIWYHRNWMTTCKSVFDGLIYGLFTAGTFGWLWPR